MPEVEMPGIVAVPVPGVHMEVVVPVPYVEMVVMVEVIFAVAVVVLAEPHTYSAWHICFIHVCMILYL